jgi:Fe-S cluster assembly scaffold protein SufB
VQVGSEQLFDPMSRGLSENDAAAGTIVTGCIEPIVKERS